MNNLSIVGRAGRDPEIKYFDNGNIVCNVSLAVRKRAKGEEATDWFNVEAWGKTAEILQNYVQRGDLVAITGAMTSDTYTDKNGNKQTKWFVKTKELTLLEKKRTGAEPQQQAATQPAANRAPAEYVEAPMF